MAMHIEQPGSRQSQPAARKISGSPSAMAWRLTSCEPGTTSTRSFGFTLRPFKIAAAARRSEMRELVQLPMKTTSTGWPSQRLAAFEAHVGAAPWRWNRAPSDRLTREGSGSGASIGTPMPGLVPYVIIGSSASASIETLRS